MSQYLSLVFWLTIVPYTIAVIMPNWRWWLGYATIVGGLLTALWIVNWIQVSGPDYRDGGGGGALGLIIFGLLTYGFIAGIIVRAMTLLLAKRGLSLRYIAAVTVATYLLAIALTRLA